MGGLTDNTVRRHVRLAGGVADARTAGARSRCASSSPKRYRYNPTDERALNMFGSAKAKEITGGIVNGLKIVLTFIGVLTLAIGGVGIMNIMFVNVQERTREIGVRKALGAQPPRDPAAVPARRPGDDVRRRRPRHRPLLRPGLAAQPAAVSRRAARRRQPRHRHPSGAVAVSWSAICSAILMVVGLVSGLLPALKASRLDPIEALRYE